MSGFIFGLIWVLAYYLYKSKGDEGGGGDTIPESSLGWVVSYWALLAILPSMLFRVSPTLSILVYFSLTLFCFPVVPTSIAKWCRQPKIAFFFGSKCYVRFRKNPMSGGLYYGYLAAMNNRDEEAKLQNLQWLADRLANQTKPLYSGDIVMFSVLHAQLNKSVNLATELRRLRWLPQDSIPKKIAILAYKYALAEVLNANNVPELAPITLQWGDRHKNSAAKYIRKTHIALLEGRRIDNFMFEVLRRRAGLPKSVRSWLCKNVEKSQGDVDIDQMDKAHLIHALKQTGINAKSHDHERTNALINALITNQKHEFWRQRAQELGAWDFDAIWADYKMQLSDMKASDENDSRIADEARFERIDQAHKSLKYLEKAIERSTDPSIQGSSVEHLKMWFKVLEQMDLLTSDKSSLQTAFSNNYETLWSWAAGLWNEKKEQRLAYFIANWCHPHALECGYTDFSEVIEFMRGKP